nr:nuclear pore complex protein nup43 [Quercus suber]
MAITGTGTALRDLPQIHRFPQTKYIDAVRWLPQLSAFDRFAIFSLFNFDSNTPSLKIHSLNPQSQTLTLTPQSTFSPPSRISSLKTSQTPTIATSTFSDSLHLLFANAVDASLESKCSVPMKELHIGAVSYVDVKDGGAECMTVEGLRSAVVYLQSLTDQWVSIRSVGLKFLGVANQQEEEMLHNHVDVHSMVQSAVAASSFQPHKEMKAIRDLENFFGEHQEFGGHLFAVQDKRIRNIWMKVREAPQMMRFEEAPQMHFEERAKMLIKAVHLRLADFLEFFLDPHLGPLLMPAPEPLVQEE